MGIGQRLAVDVMVEMSNHLLDNATVFPLLAPASAGPGSILSIFSTTTLYPGAQLVLGWQSSTPATTEIITVIAVQSSTHFTANLLHAHAANEILFGATFPDQQPTDPVFTQQEILGYLAQAQNEFLTKVPAIFAFFGGPAGGEEIQAGVSTYLLPSTVIELERVALQSLLAAQTYALVSITRVGGVVTAILSTDITQPPTSAAAGLQIVVSDVSDPSFNSITAATPGQEFTLISATTLGVGGFGSGGLGQYGYGSGPPGGAGAVLSWDQAGSDTGLLTSTGTISIPLWTRLYEGSQEQLALNNPAWFANLTGLPPTTWYEDRTGTLGWGVGPLPLGNYWAELLVSVRGDEGLGLLSGFLVPDIFVPYLKYKALEYCWSKAGVQRSPSMAKYCKGRFDFGVMLADRFLRNVIEKAGAAGASVGGIF